MRERGDLWGEDLLGSRRSRDEVQSFSESNAEGGGVGGVDGRVGMERWACGCPDEGRWRVGGRKGAVVNGEDTRGRGDEA